MAILNLFDSIICMLSGRLDYFNSIKCLLSMLCYFKWKTETTQSVWCHRLFVSLPHFLFFFDSLSFCIPFIFPFVHRISWIWPLTQSYVINFGVGNELNSFQLTEFHLRWPLAHFVFGWYLNAGIHFKCASISYAKKALSIKHWAVSLFSAIPFNLMMRTVLWFTSALMVSIANQIKNFP